MPPHALPVPDAADPCVCHYFAGYEPFLVRHGVERLHVATVPAWSHSRAVVRRVAVELGESHSDVEIVVEPLLAESETVVVKIAFVVVTDVEEPASELLSLPAGSSNGPTGTTGFEWAFPNDAIHLGVPYHYYFVGR